MKPWLTLTKVAAAATVATFCLPFLVILFNPSLAMEIGLLGWVFVGPAIGVLTLVFGAVTAGIYVNEPGQPQRRRTVTIVASGALLLAVVIVLATLSSPQGLFASLLLLIAAASIGIGACVVIGIAWRRGVADLRTPGAAPQRTSPSLSP